MMPPELNNTVSFIRVFPWRWTVQKGWSGGDNKDATTLNCAWRYNWNNTAESTLDVEYVPMRHNRYWNSYENINNKMNSTHVLGFNEPEVEGKNFMTVNEVISQWPNLLESGLRLIAGYHHGNLGWLYEFIDQADALNYRVDFVAVHYYKIIGLPIRCITGCMRFISEQGARSGSQSGITAATGLNRIRLIGKMPIKSGNC